MTGQQRRLVSALALRDPNLVRPLRPPRIRLIVRGWWQCRTVEAGCDLGFVTGRGTTPIAAYLDWLDRQYPRAAR